MGENQMLSSQDVTKAPKGAVADDGLPAVVTVNGSLWSASSCFIEFGPDWKRIVEAFLGETLQTGSCKVECCPLDADGPDGFCEGHRGGPYYHSAETKQLVPTDAPEPLPYFVQ